jgi:hypothetical protein
LSRRLGRHLLKKRIRLSRTISTANGTSHREGHLATNRFDIELVLLAAVALNLEFDHDRGKLQASCG